jgi:non-ribosomal peptide synthetase component E (peptide arylation enzyme)
VKQRLHDLLRIQAERRPDAMAAVFQDVPTSYSALEQMNNHLASALQAARAIPLIFSLRQDPQACPKVW